MSPARGLWFWFSTCSTFNQNSVKADMFSSSRPHDRAQARLSISISSRETQPNVRCVEPHGKAYIRLSTSISSRETLPNVRCVEGTPDKNWRRTSLYNNFQFLLYPDVVFLSNVRGLSDKYLASPPDDVTIARRVYYRVEPSCRRLTSKLQSNQICGFVLTPCRSERVHGF